MVLISSPKVGMILQTLENIFFKHFDTHNRISSMHDWPLLKNDTLNEGFEFDLFSSFHPESMKYLVKPFFSLKSSLLLNTLL